CYFNSQFRSSLLLHESSRSRCRTLLDGQHLRPVYMSLPGRLKFLAVNTVVFFLCCLFHGSPGLAQQAGGVAPSGPQVRMVRAVIGAKGENRNGTYAMTDRRTTFYIPDDHEVIVYFEWEGPQGKHHCEGSVRGPNGEFASMSSFDYNAMQSRFGGYWKI